MALIIKVNVVLLLLDDIKESNLLKVCHDMSLKYLFLYFLYFLTTNQNWNSDSMTF